MKYTEERQQFHKYKVYMSSGKPLAIDEDEVDKIMRGISTGQPVKVRQGIFNPSYFVSIGIDTERYQEWKDSIQHKIDDGGHEVLMFPVLENLPDIFQIEAPKEKRLQ